MKGRPLLDMLRPRVDVSCPPNFEAHHDAFPAVMASTPATVSFGLQDPATELLKLSVSTPTGKIIRKILRTTMRVFVRHISPAFWGQVKTCMIIETMTIITIIKTIIKTSMIIGFWSRKPLLHGTSQVIFSNGLRPSTNRGRRCPSKISQSDVPYGTWGHYHSLPKPS